MEKTFAQAEELVDHIKEYVNLQVESAKLNVAEKSSAVIANMVAAIIAGVMTLFFVIFANIALPIVVGDWLGKPWAGYLIIAGINLVVGFFIWMRRKQLIQLRILNSFSRLLFKDRSF